MTSVLAGDRGVPLEREGGPQRVQDRIAERCDEFLTSSGMDERDPANQVMDALFDQEAPARSKIFAAQVVAKAAGQAIDARAAAVPAGAHQNPAGSAASDGASWSVG